MTLLYAVAAVALVLTMPRFTALELKAVGGTLGLIVVLGAIVGFVRERARGTGLGLQLVAAVAAGAATLIGMALGVAASVAFGPEPRGPADETFPSWAVPGLLVIGLVAIAAWESRAEIRRERARTLERWRSDPALVGRRDP